MIEIQSLRSSSGNGFYFAEIADVNFKYCGAYSDDGKHRWSGLFGYCAAAAEVPLETGDYVRLRKGAYGLNMATKRISCGYLSQSSDQDLDSGDILNEYRPQLSSGLTENPCHHEQLIGSILIPPTNQGSSGQVFTASMEGFGAISGYLQCNVVVSGFFLDTILMDGIACIISHDLYSEYNPYYKTEVEWHGRNGAVVRKYKREWNEESFTLTSERVTPPNAAAFVRKYSGGYILYDNKFEYSAIPDVIGYWEYSHTSFRCAESIPLNSLSVRFANLLQDVSNKFNPGRAVALRDYSYCFAKNLNLRGGVNINMVENLSSLNFAGIKDIPKKLASLGIKPKTLKEFAGKTTSAYFTKKYGIDNDIRDLQEFCRFIHSDNFGIMKYHKQVVKGHSSIKNRYGGTCDFYTKALLKPGPNDPSLSERIVNTFGMEMTPAQLWAAVPFSFAIDWVVQIGSMLERLDALAVAKTRFTCEYCLYSYKYSVLVPEDLINYYLGNIEVATPIKYIVYDRCISRSLPPPSLFLTKNNMVGDHITEANALVINGLSH